MKEQVTFRSRPLSRRRFLGATSQAALAMLAGARLSRAAAAKPGSGYDDSPAKDRVTMVTWYEVDPSWPQKPAGYTWGAGSGVAVDASDRVWIFTRSSPAVQVYDTDGGFLFAWDSEPWRTKKLKTPHYLRIDPEQNVWLCDVGRHVIHKCTQDGKLLMTLGTMDEPGQDPEHFNKPTDVAVTAGGDIYISDGYVNSRVIHYDTNGRFVKQWGTQGIGPGEFNVVHSIAVDSAGRLYVADRSNARVQVFDNNGRFVAEWRDVIVPWGIWITGSDEIWVCGSPPMQWQKDQEMFGIPPKDQLFMRFDPDGRVRQIWTLDHPPAGGEPEADTTASRKPGQVNWVHGIALDSKGNVYLGDIKGKRFQKFVKHLDPRAWPV